MDLHLLAGNLKEADLAYQTELKVQGDVVELRNNLPTVLFLLSHMSRVSPFHLSQEKFGEFELPTISLVRRYTVCACP